MGMRSGASALLVAMLAACGGGGGGGSSNSGGDSTQAPSSGVSHTNPLNLAPPPQFSTSARAVTYDDCFPAFDDVEVGDVVVSKVETYVPDTGGIYTGNQTVTVTAVAPDTFNGHAAVRVTTDSPPYLRSDNVMEYGGDRVALYLDGGSANKSLIQYLNNEAGTRVNVKNFSNELSVIGILPAAGTGVALALGDFANSSYTQTYTSALLSDYSRTYAVAEKTRFIGVEENVQVEAGTFDYACVFRYEQTDVANGQTAVYDYYTHKWSTLKVLVHNSVMRPLVTEVVSNSAIDRRKPAP